MAIVAVCVTVFVIFGLIAARAKGARDYLAEVRTGGANRRWQAAFELSKVLQAGKDPALADPRFVAELRRRSSTRRRTTTRGSAATWPWPWAGSATARRCPPCCEASSDGGTEGRPPTPRR